jgi:hypothetical protein
LNSQNTDRHFSLIFCPGSRCRFYLYASDFPVVAAISRAYNFWKTHIQKQSSRRSPITGQEESASAKWQREASRPNGPLLSLQPTLGRCPKPPEATAKATAGTGGSPPDHSLPTRRSEREEGTLTDYVEGIGPSWPHSHGRGRPLRRKAPAGPPCTERQTATSRSGSRTRPCS